MANIATSDELRDGARNQREHTDRCHQHDEVDEADHDSVQTFEHVEQRLRFILWHLDQPDTHEDRDEDDLEHVAIARSRRQKIRGYNVFEQL